MTSDRRRIPEAKNISQLPSVEVDARKCSTTASSSTSFAARWARHFHPNVDLFDIHDRATCLRWLSACRGVPLNGVLASVLVAFELPAPFVSRVSSPSPSNSVCCSSTLACFGDSGTFAGHRIWRAVFDLQLLHTHVLRTLMLNLVLPHTVTSSLHCSVDYSTPCVPIAIVRSGCASLDAA